MIISTDTRNALLVCLSSKECMNLLNGDLSVLVRKKFSKDFVGLIYIYCAKTRPYLVRGNGLVDNLTKEYDKNYIPEPKKFELYNFEDEGYSAEFYNFFNGKVVARFWCDKTEEVKYSHEKRQYFSESLVEKDLLSKSCLTDVELFQYLLFRKVGYAIHITNLEIFDKPKELSEFHKIDNSNGFICFKCPHFCTDDSAGYSIDSCDLGFQNCEKTRLTRAPKTFCYVEI